MALQNESGFTLSELIITLGISLVILMLITSVYILSQSAFRKSQTRYELIQNARVFIDKITRELRQTPEIVTILPETISGAPSEIIFQDGHDGSKISYVKYYLFGADLKRQISHYYFIADPLTYVKWNAEDGFGGTPLEVVDEDDLVGEYLNSIFFFGSSNIVNIEANFSKNGENNYIATKIAGRNL
ncbi:MAG: hypothetical protein V1770_00700 [bacterium]